MLFVFICDPVVNWQPVQAVPDVCWDWLQVLEQLLFSVFK